MGLGNLTKGPFGMVPLLIISVFLIKEKEARRLISKEFVVGYLILGVTSLPWVILFVDRVGLGRAITLMRENKILSRQAPVYFYLLEIWAQFLPWSLFLPFIGFHVWKERGRIWHSPESLFLIWFILLFVLLTLFKVRASRYLLPALPPVALLLGGMWKKKGQLLLIPFLASLLVWHSVEIYWIRKDLAYSPGKVLAQELQPLVRETPLIGYRLDLGAIEEINFYLDRVIPALEEMTDLSDQLSGNERRLALMPKQAYDKIRLQSGFSMAFVREFPYKEKKGRRLVLVSNRPNEIPDRKE